jgi:hypothetical protein
MNLKNLKKMITPQNMLILALVVSIICVVVFKTKESYTNKKGKPWKPNYKRCKKVRKKAHICERDGPFLPKNPIRIQH